MIHVFVRLAAALALCCALSAPAAALQRQRSLQQLADEGEQALQAKRYRDAFDAFVEAATRDPRDPSMLAAAGYAAAMLGANADAEAWLTRALQADARYTPASLVLGQVLYRQGRIAEAIEVYEAATRYAPTDETLTSRLAEWRKDAQLQNRFYEARGAHFSVLFEGPADDALARKAVEVLEQAYYRVGTALTTYPTRPITVVLYTRQQFQDITRSPDWAGAVYDGRIKVPVAGVGGHDDDLARMLEHELVHAMVSTLAGPTVPTWLHEGLATTLEPGGGEWTERVLAGTTTRLPLSRLSRGFLGMNTDAALLAYAESTAAVQRIIALRGMPAVVSLIQALGRGIPLETAFQQSVFMQLDDFERLVSR